MPSWPVPSELPATVDVVDSGTVRNDGPIRIKRPLQNRAREGSATAPERGLA